MKLSSRAVTPVVRALLSCFCGVDAAELSRVPRRGPLIIVTNHINFLDSPLLYSFLHPRGIMAVVKEETWDSRLFGYLADIWEAIPLNREATDTQAMRAVLAALEARRIVILSPEGTRSHDGKLRKGHGGVIQLAARSGATIIPVVHVGTEGFWKNLRSFRRTRIAFRVGTPFRLVLPESGLTRSVREEATDELMRRLARLMPERLRGAYSEGLERPGRWLSELPTL